MKMLNNRETTTPRRMSAERIRRMIVAEGLRPGDALPNYDQLSARLEVSRMTVHRAMTDLVKAGLIQRLHGKGCFVRKSISPGSSKLSTLGVISALWRTQLVQLGYLREMMQGILASTEWDGIALNILSVRSEDRALDPGELAATTDGVLLIGEIDGAYVAALANKHIPVVLVDCPRAMPVDSIACDNAGATTAVMDHLFSLGHRRIAFLSQTVHGVKLPVVEELDSRERREAYLTAMIAHDQAHDVHVVMVQEASQLQTSLHDLLNKIRCKKNPISAVLANSPGEADMFYQAAQDAGLKIPQDVSLAVAVGAHDDRFLPNGLRLAYSHVSFETMGKRAVEVLKERCQGALHSLPSLMRIGYTFYPGNSTSAFFGGSKGKSSRPGTP